MTSLMMGGDEEGITGWHVAVVAAAVVVSSYSILRVWFVGPKMYVVDMLKTSYGRC